MKEEGDLPTPSLFSEFRLRPNPRPDPAVAFITVPVIMRARSEAISTAAFAVLDLLELLSPSSGCYQPKNV